MLTIPTIPVDRIDPQRWVDAAIDLLVRGGWIVPVIFIIWILAKHKPWFRDKA